MDAPQIQYAKTSDGVNIAYWTIGSGHALVHMPLLQWSHAQLEWTMPEPRGWYELLARRYQLVRYDPRGTGLSDRDVTDYSVDALVRDLEAVADRLALASFALFAPSRSGFAAVTYAARYPKRVSHLILFNALTRGRDYSLSSQMRAAMSLAERDWELFTETTQHVALGWAEGEEARKWAAFLRECISPEANVGFWSALRNADVTPLLEQVQAPTLVIHRREAVSFPIVASRRLATTIRDARMVVVEGNSDIPYRGDFEAVARAINEFLSLGEEPSRDDSTPSSTAIILFADIADSTALTERLGDAAFREKARALDDALRAAIASNGGTAIDGKLLGDGVLATFGAAREAIACAAACHELAGSRATGQGPRENNEPLLLHVGIHAGDVIREEGNVYGGAVNIAARVAGEAAAGETLVSATVRELARTSAGVSFEDRGERELKGVGEPVRVWAVGASESR